MGCSVASCEKDIGPRGFALTFGCGTASPIAAASKAMNAGFPKRLHTR